MASAAMHKFLTYAWIRDEEWMGYTYPSEVRRFLENYGQWEDCKVFRQFGAFDNHDRWIEGYEEVFRSEWLSEFGVEG